MKNTLKRIAEGKDSIEVVRNLAREALMSQSDGAQPAVTESHKQEPVAITITGKLGNIYSFTGDYSLKKGDKVYTKPTQRTWVNTTTWRGLTDDEKTAIYEEQYNFGYELIEKTEAKLKAKNSL